MLFHGKRHPNEMGAGQVSEFLSHLAVVGRVSASTQNQALAALVFLYGQVLDAPALELEDLVRARVPTHLPVVLTQAETNALLARLTGESRLVASLLYGAGLRLLECLRLRVKDLDLERGEILVRDGKGRKDRVTMLPRSLAADLRAQLRGRVRCTRAISWRASVRSRYRMRWRESIPVRRTSGAGNGCSPRAGAFARWRRA